MGNYSLTVQIDSADLPVLRAAGERTVLVRRLRDAGACVAWAVLDLAPSRRLAWNDEVALYASDTAGVAGNIIHVAASAPALLRCGYRYDGAGFQGPVPDGGLAADMLQIGNAVPASTAAALLLGLAQCYSLDGNPPAAPQPLNAQSVPARQFARYVVSQQLWIYLASSSETGLIVPPPLPAAASRQVTSAATLLSFGAGSADQTVRYSAALGCFYPG